MNGRAAVRRAFPYFIVAIAGFALAYVVVFTFILPSSVVPPEKGPYVPDSSQIIKPIPQDEAMDDDGDTSVVQGYFPRDFTPPPAPVPVDVPDLIGFQLADARAVLNRLQLTTAVSYDTSSFQVPNTVLRQQPAAGTKVPEHGMVTVIVSRFPPASPDKPNVIRADSSNANQ